MPIQLNTHISTFSYSRQETAFSNRPGLSTQNGESVPYQQLQDTVTLSQHAEEFQFYLPNRHPFFPEEDEQNPPASSGLSEESESVEIPQNPLALEDGEEKEEYVPPGQRTAEGEPLQPSEKMDLAKLKQRDRDIRAHEQAHLAAAAAYARSGASFSYKEGPDGKKYAIHGEVMIDSSRAPSPEKTISKMRVVRQAALAPASPSPQDLKVAANATRRLVDAVQELRLDKLHEAKTKMKEIVRKIEENEKEIKESTHQEIDEDLLPAPTKKEKVTKLKAPEIQTTFRVNSFKKYTVNVAQYQYESSAMFA